MNETGQFISKKRKEKGMTQKELAEQLGVTNKAVSKWETGQGLPDVGVLPKLGETLGVSVDEILQGGEKPAEEEPAETGKTAETGEMAETGKTVEPWKQAEDDVNMPRFIFDYYRRKLRKIRICPGMIAGILFFFLSAACAALQIWYVLRGRNRGWEYLASWMPFAVNGLFIFGIWTGGMCIAGLRKWWLKAGSVAAAAVLFLTNIGAGIAFYPGGKEMLSLSPDFSSVMCLKVDENGRAVFYRQRGILFGTEADVFPFTVEADVKVQWLTGDVCALTYESPDDGGVHQYVVTYGDRNEYPASSYYYVYNAVYGNWQGDSSHGGYRLSAGTEPYGGILIETPEGSEYYREQDCLQYGTLALVFPKENPKWTLVLNEDCVIQRGESSVSEGGTLTLCRVGMDKTAPVILSR